MWLIERLTETRLYICDRSFHIWKALGWLEGRGKEPFWMGSQQLCKVEIWNFAVVELWRMFSYLSDRFYGFETFQKTKMYGPSRLNHDFLSLSVKPFCPGHPKHILERVPTYMPPTNPTKSCTIAYYSHSSISHAPCKACSLYKTRIFG